MSFSVAILHSDEFAAFRALLALFDTVFDTVFAEEHGEPMSVPDDAHLASVLADPDFVAIVARTEQGDVVGGLTLRFWRSYRQSGDECYLYDLAVLEQYRRRGIARQLVQHAIAHAKARNVVAMWVQAEADDDGALAFYRTLNPTSLDVAHFELM